MKKLVLISAITTLCLSLSACSYFQSEDSQQSTNDSSSFMASDSESNFSNGTSEVADFSSSKGDENNAELVASLQERINEIAPSGIFASNFDETSSEQDGYYFYASGCYILGDSLEETYQYTARTIQNDYYEDYPYTPAQVMDSALQEYFALPLENLHNMIENYEADIDGYWAPMGGGGATATTTIISCDVDDNIATLSCETRNDIASKEEPGTLSTVIMEYSGEYGWRFSSCIAS